MTRDELIQIITEVQRHKSEFDELEAKTARVEHPKGFSKRYRLSLINPAGGLVSLTCCHIVLGTGK